MSDSTPPIRKPVNVVVTPAPVFLPTVEDTIARLLKEKQHLSLAKANLHLLELLLEKERRKRKTDDERAEEILDYKKSHTWDETDEHFDVARGTSARFIRRWRKRKKKQ
jgi:hypothetical protein